MFFSLVQHRDNTVLIGIVKSAVFSPSSIINSPSMHQHNLSCVGSFTTHVLQPQAGNSTDYGIMYTVLIRRQCILCECKELSNALTSSSQCCCSSSQRVCASLVSRRWSCSSFCSSSNCSRLTAPCSNSLMRPALTASSACKTPHGESIKITLD